MSQIELIKKFYHIFTGSIGSFACPGLYVIEICGAMDFNRINSHTSLTSNEIRGPTWCHYLMLQEALKSYFGCEKRVAWWTHQHPETVTSETMGYSITQNAEFVNYISMVLMRERRNSIANALELHLSCINPLKWPGDRTSYHISCDVWPRLHKGIILPIQFKK